VNQDVKILQSLGKWFERQKRSLPWREDPSVYRVWVSEIMLQQTQVVTVIPYFEKFIAKFPTVQKLARANEQEVMQHWAGLGYYSRARNLHLGAKQIALRKKFPETRLGWLDIPGVGEYTAGAILSIALDQPEAILDGNVERVISRMHQLERDKKKLWAISREWVEAAFKNKIRPSVWNQALMELGATICTPKSPKCNLCPVSTGCLSFKKGTQDQYPPKKPKKEWKEIKEEIYFYFDRKGHVLLQKNDGHQWRKGLWDGLRKKMNPDLLKFKKLGTVKTKHIVTRHKIERTSHIYVQHESVRTLWVAWEPREICERKWVSVLKADEVPTGSAFKKTLHQIREKFPGVGRQN
jgi:A/G-specific adenine glycosylase